MPKSSCLLVWPLFFSRFSLQICLLFFYNSKKVTNEDVEEEVVILEKLQCFDKKCIINYTYLSIENRFYNTMWIWSQRHLLSIDWPFLQGVSMSTVSRDAPHNPNTNSLENILPDMFPFHNMYYYYFPWLSYECRCLHTLSLCIQLL